MKRFFARFSAKTATSLMGSDWMFSRIPAIPFRFTSNLHYTGSSAKQHSAARHFFLMLVNAVKILVEKKSKIPARYLSLIHICDILHTSHHRIIIKQNIEPHSGSPFSFRKEYIISRPQESILCFEITISGNLKSHLIRQRNICQPISLRSYHTSTVSPGNDTAGLFSRNASNSCMCFFSLRKRSPSFL